MFLFAFVFWRLHFPAFDHTWREFEFDFMFGEDNCGETSELGFLNTIGIKIRDEHLSA